MYCSKCGKQIELGQKFCGNCGNKISTSMKQTEFDKWINRDVQKGINKLKEESKKRIKKDTNTKKIYQIVIIGAIIVIALAIWITYNLCNSSLGVFTEENYNKVKEGMSYSEVKKLIGPCDETDTTFLSYGHIGRTWYYLGQGPYKKRGIYLVFMNDKLKDKKEYVSSSEFERRNKEKKKEQQQETKSQYKEKTENNITGIEQAIKDGMLSEEYMRTGITQEEIYSEYYNGNLNKYYTRWEACLTDAKKLNILRTNEEI